MAVKRIALLLGAGASSAFGYPTTKQFYERIKVHDNLQELIFNHIKESPNVKDIEHVLTILDQIIALGKNPLTQKPMATIIPSVVLTQKIPVTWEQFVNYCIGLKNTIIDEIYLNYHFKENTKNQAFEAFDDLMGTITLAGSLLKDVFTLNYDRLLEEYLFSRNIDYTDGFAQKNRRNIWSSALFRRTKNQVEASTLFRLFKLHGSLSWRAYEDTIECVTTEEATRTSYHKKNIFIYPTEICDSTSEPYSTLYQYFRLVKEFTDVFIIIGYSFRDEPINQVIADYVKNGNTCIVISPSVNEDAKDIISSLNKIKPKGKIKPIAGLFPDTFVNQKIREILMAE